MLPALISFAISFSLFGIIPEYVLSREVIVSPLATADGTISPPQVSAIATVLSSASPMLQSTPLDTFRISPSSHPVLQSSSSKNQIALSQPPNPTPISTQAPRPTSSTFPNITPIPSTTPVTTSSPSPKISPTPSPTSSPITLAQIEEWFTKYANKESVNRDLLKKIAVCESGLNSGATNGIYGGLYQFSAGTWASTRRAMNMNTDQNLRFNAEEAIKTAAFRIATLGNQAWPNCSR